MLKPIFDALKNWVKRLINKLVGKIDSKDAQ